MLFLTEVVRHIKLVVRVLSLRHIKFVVRVLRCPFVIDIQCYDETQFTYRGLNYKGIVQPVPTYEISFGTTYAHVQTLRQKT